MNPESRYVFDTNALVSAVLFPQSVPARAFFAALGGSRVLLSTTTAAELNAVLARPKFDRYVTREERDQFQVELLARAIVVEITEEIRVCRDPKDDKFLELAVCGGASGIVTGDQDLLVLHPFRDIPILTPAQFLESIRPESRNGS